MAHEDASKARARFEAIAQRVPLLERELLAARSIVVDREARLNEAQVRLADRG